MMSFKDTQGNFTHIRGCDELTGFKLYKGFRGARYYFFH
jgi:hypothetical protein